jgi:hypothetical protein
MAPSRTHHGAPDDPGPPASRRHAPEGTGGVPSSVRQAEDAIAQVAQRGRISGSAPATHPPSPADIELNRQLDVLDQLGSEPPTVNVARNDADFGNEGAHTLDRHGPDIPLRRDPNFKTIEGRVHGDDPWRRENSSFKWIDHTTMNRTINDYISQNWNAIRGDLAIKGEHEGIFDAGHRVGVGYINKGMYGAGPREAQFWSTSLVKIRMRLVEGSDPPQPFLLTAFPAALV